MVRRRIMISSTARDLPKHREQVRLACERAGFAPHDMMEHLTAEDASAVEVSLRMVADSDVYVGVLAYRYGTIPPGYDKSITEMEYDEAVRLNKPRLIFFIHKDHPVTFDDVDTGPGAEKLKGLKERVGEARVAAFFKSPEDLRAHVVEALTVLREKFDEDKETGETTTTRVVAQLHRTISIPAPPEPYVAHPYTLLQSRDLVGRQAELNALTDWVAKPSSEAFDAHIFCFVAIGGMGKSALTWKWFDQIAPNEMKPLAGRMWWSFYESDATFENFLNRALCYVGSQTEEQVRTLPWQEREALLLRHLNEQTYLVVLDGLERILIAYNRMDASRLADDDYDKQTANVVAGAIGLPSTAAQSFVGEHRMRQTMDPRAGSFLRKLAQVDKSRILISTRLYPTELQFPTGYPRPGCSAYFLGGLSDSDALGLWRALRVSGSQQELLPIFRSVENHPLLIQALASEVANDKRSPGDFDKWRAENPQFDPTSLPLVQSRTQILEYALRGLTKKVREVLRTLVGFRMPATYSSLEALLVGAKKACRSVQELDRVLTELEDRGLVGWDRDANRYDAHPIVRGVVWQFTDVKDQRAVYRALEAHFEPMAVPSSDNVHSLADLTPAIEHYHTLVGLRRYVDAFALFADRLSDAAFYRLAAHQEIISWLERLVDVEGLPLVTKKDVLNSLALSYHLSGQPGRGAELRRKIFEIPKGAENLIYLGNHGVLLIDIGALREAEGALCQTLFLTHNLGDDFEHAVALQYFGGLHTVIGNYALSCIALIRSRRLFRQQKNLQGEGTVSSYLVESWLQRQDFEKASVLSLRAWELASTNEFEGDFVQAALLQGRAFLGIGDSVQADERLHHALTRARAVNMVALELPALIALAELELKRGRLPEAKARLDDVWEVAKRGPYPLQQADAFNVLAEISAAEGNKPAAIEAANKAYKAAWCDGPPYAYHWGLQKAKAHLVALGAPEPDMPPFDDKKFEPLPEVEINPNDEYWVDPDKLD